MRLIILIGVLGTGAASRGTRTDVASEAGWRVRSATVPAAASAAVALPAAPTFFFADDAGYNGFAAYAGLPADGCVDPATITGGRGEAVTFSRASTRFCPADLATEASGTMCTSGQVCIAEKKVGNFVTATNICLRSEQFDNAAWTFVGTGSVTPNVVVAPDGATTADFFSAGAANAGVTQAITTSTAAKHNFSVWAQCASGTCAPRLLITGTGNSAGDVTCVLSATAAWKRFNCLSPAAYGAGLTAVTLRVDVGAASASTSFWGAMDTIDDEEAQRGPYVATTTVAVTRASEVMTIAWNNAAVASTGSASAEIYRYAATTYNRGSLMRTASNGRIGEMSYVSGVMDLYDGTTQCALAGAFATSRVTRIAFRWGVAGNMTINNITDASSTTCAFDGAMPTGATTQITYSSDTLNANGYVGKICLDASTSRCYF